MSTVIFEMSGEPVEPREVRIASAAVEPDRSVQAVCEEDYDPERLVLACTCAEAATIECSIVLENGIWFHASRCDVSSANAVVPDTSVRTSSGRIVERREQLRGAPIARLTAIRASTSFPYIAHIFRQVIALADLLFKKNRTKHTRFKPGKDVGRFLNSHFFLYESDRVQLINENMFTPCVTPVAARRFQLMFLGSVLMYLFNVSRTRAGTPIQPCAAQKKCVFFNKRTPYERLLSAPIHLVCSRSSANILEIFLNEWAL